MLKRPSVFLLCLVLCLVDFGLCTRAERRPFVRIFQNLCHCSTIYRGIANLRWLSTYLSRGRVVAAAVAAALASSSVLESLSPDGAIRHRHGRAIALPRGRKARHPTQSSQIVGAASRVRCCCSRWLAGVQGSRSCCRCRRRCSGGGSDGGGCGTSKMRHPLVEQLAQSQLPAAPRIGAQRDRWQS